MAGQERYSLVVSKEKRYRKRYRRKVIMPAKLELAMGFEPPTC